MAEIKETFTAIDDDGREVEYSVLITFDLDETGKRYVIYTDGEEDEKGTKAYASTYTLVGEHLIILDELTLDEEWEAVEEAIEKVKQLQ